jgi:hypothetical protein
VRNILNAEFSISVEFDEACKAYGCGFVVIDAFE